MAKLSPIYRFVDKDLAYSIFEDSFYMYDRTSIIEIYGSVEAAQEHFAAQRALRGHASYMR